VEILEELLNLFLPSACIFCKSPDSNICPECLQKIELAPRAVNRFGINGYASCVYSTAVAKLISEFKESQQTSLAKVIAPAMAQALLNFDLENCSLLPMPSKRESFAKRGFEPAAVLANAIARQFAKEHKALIPVQKILNHSSRVADQASLSGQDRRTNLIGSMVARSRLPGRNLSQRVILIDDIVTTGSTFAEAKRCLTEIGVQVLGFVTFAETLPKNLQKRHARFV
jgi:ComF family protein